MKSIKLLFCLFSVFIGLSGNAQVAQLWGLNYRGGIPTGSQVGAGNIYSIRSDASNFIQRYCFVNTYAGETSYGSLMQATNGKLYGTASSGGLGGSGVLFSYDTSTATYTKLLDFDDGTNDAQSPVGNLIQAVDGNLYGMTLYGGSNGSGVLFSFNPISNSYMKLIDFGGGTNDAETPFGSLVEASNGKLYGTAGGGINFGGVLFSYETSTSTYTKLVDFDAGAIDASGPTGALIQASNGKLYGLTSGGGTSGNGVLYRFDPLTNVYTKLYNFNAINGANPLFGATLVQVGSDKLYGMTNGGGTNFQGVLFRYDFSLNSYTKLIDFDGSTKGAYPYGSLIYATDGKLYGMTAEGGALDLGVIFSYDPVSTTMATLVDFNGRFNGANPWGNVFQAANGKLYGMTSGGGSGFSDYNTSGVFFSYDIQTSTFVKKFDFNTGMNGNYPTGKMTYGTSGLFYGTALGGADGYGALFRLNTMNSTFSKLYDFNYTNGADPSGSLVKAADGLFYGVTSSGGNDSAGVLFSYDPGTSTYTKRFDFNSTTNGSMANGGLIQASNNLLYGLTTEGGDSTYGVMYSFDASSNTYTKLVDFDGAAKGASPKGSLVQAANGKLYGLTSTGGIYDNATAPGLVGTGVLFSYDPATSTYTKLHDFGNEVLNDGAVPEGSLLYASNGKLYGITLTGGTSDWGIMFEFDPVSNVYTILLDFLNIFWRPWGDLMQASNGKIYGATSDYSIGTMFEYNPATSSFTFSTNVTGGLPSANTALSEIPLNVGMADNSNAHSVIHLFPNPSNGMIFISYRSTTNQSSVKIINLIGEIIYNEKYSGMHVSNNINLQVPAGIYFVTVDDGEKVRTEKLIIRR